MCARISYSGWRFSKYCAKKLAFCWKTMLRPIFMHKMAVIWSESGIF
jgi:hypothetical protein